MKDLPEGENLPRRGDVVIWPQDTSAQRISKTVTERLVTLFRYDYRGTLPLLVTSNRSYAQFYGQTTGMPLTFSHRALATMAAGEVVRDP